MYVVACMNVPNPHGPHALMFFFQILPKELGAEIIPMWKIEYQIGRKKRNLSFFLHEYSIASPHLMWHQEGLKKNHVNQK